MLSKDVGTQLTVGELQLDKSLQTAGYGTHVSMGNGNKPH